MNLDKKSKRFEWSGIGKNKKKYSKYQANNKELKVLYFMFSLYQTENTSLYYQISI